MDINKILETIKFVEILKDTRRHSFTSRGRQESVAEHCWRTAIMAYLVSDEFPEANVEKLLKTCIIHDLGEAFIGDIPAFEKTDVQEANENAKLLVWLNSLPKPFSQEMSVLYEEFINQSTLEAKICKAIDNLEALIQHNQASLSTWLPIERDLQLTYGDDKVAFSDYLIELRKAIRDESIKKMNK